MTHDSLALDTFSDTLSLDDRANIALETFDSFELGSVGYLKGQERTIKDQGFGASDAAMALVKKHITDTTEIVRQHKEASQVGRQGDGIKEFVDCLGHLEDSLVALVALQVGLQTVADGVNIQAAMRALGRAIETELWAGGLRSYDKKLAARLETFGRRRGSMAQRRAAVKKVAKENGYDKGNWKDSQRTTAGKWLVEVLLQTPVFVRVDDGDEGSSLTITEDALSYSQEMTKHLLEAHPVPLPLLTKPNPWTGPKNAIECNGRSYEIPLLRKKCPVTRAKVAQAAKEGKLERVFEALNAIQETAWCINQPIQEMIQWCYDNDIDVEGLPSRQDISVEQVLTDRGMKAKLTDDEWEALPADLKRLRRRIVSGIKQKNRGLIGERMTLHRDLSIARILQEKGDEFYTPYNMDYRGRVYSVSYFGFQRQDYVRSMFMFKEGKPLGERGLYWLKVHIANCGDFKTDKGKTSKIPFDDRVKWVDENADKIWQTGANPKDDLWWTEADSPFLFLAACMEWVNAWDGLDDPWNYVCRIPVSFDGSCSGLQHLAAMTRCLDTASLVNVAPVDVPQDVYQTVADKVKLVVQDHAYGTGEFTQVAALALEFGIDRSLVKRNVMTYSYSSPKFGMITQQMDDTMRPLADKVIEGKLDKHPLEMPEDTFQDDKGNWRTVQGKTAAKFLGSIVFDTIEATVKKPAEAMTFLQGIAKALAHEGKPVVWETPLGLPVVLRYPQMDIQRVSLYLSDKGVRIQTRVNLSEEKPGIDKRAASNAIAPSFVHSMDACHLQMVCREAKAQGIHSMALVHDSFGCLASDAEMYRGIIKGEFHRMYSDHDVLRDIHRSALEQIDTNADRIPELPEKGALDINEVLKADYAFA